MSGAARGSLRLEVVASGAELMEAAGAFLVAREAEHSLLLGLLGAVRDRPEVFRDPYLALVRDVAGVGLVAVCTPPHDLVLSLAARPAAVDLVAADALARRRRPSGVAGPVDVLRRFVAAWGAAGGPPAEVDLRTRTYRLDRVVPPSAPPVGGPRVARSGDASLLAAWVAAFQAEALGHEPAGDPAETLLARWLADPVRIVWLWEAAGVPVAMAVAGNVTPNGRRIGSVYTPPEHRRRGYASALVAAVSQAELDGGRASCFLDTDRANPTSNRIYEAIGYRPVIDGERCTFDWGGA